MPYSVGGDNANGAFSVGKDPKYSKLIVKFIIIWLSFCELHITKL